MIDENVTIIRPTADVTVTDFEPLDDFVAYVEQRILTTDYTYISG